jgi:hypothetical protein
MAQQSASQGGDTQREKIVFEIALYPDCGLYLFDPKVGIEADSCHDQISHCGYRFINPYAENLNRGLYKFQKHRYKVSVIIVICFLGYSQNNFV